MSEAEIVWLRHAKVALALHALRAPLRADAPDTHPLLLLHGLGERTPSAVPPGFGGWPGAIWGLDFTGHGDSDVPKGGGYSVEILMADADAAIAHLGPVTIAGRGLGAYVALLLAGSRASDCRGTILCDGPGLAGGGPAPSSPRVIYPDPHQAGAPDAFALAELSQDLRPPDYALDFVRQASHLSSVERPISVCASHRPIWLSAVAEATGAEVTSLEDALADYAYRPSIPSDRGNDQA